MADNAHHIPSFSMPMFKGFVPLGLRPWIYVLFAITFQLSGGVYLGALNEMIGNTSYMREDILMCMFCSLCGMAAYFPLLFRMKFRFTNKSLLLFSAFGIAMCNISVIYIHSLSLLWIVCFISGCCKIQGTFECMSNIQLWITPKRDFTVFFPILHIIILISIQLSDLLAIYFCYIANWHYTHYFIIGVMLLNCLMLLMLTNHVRIMKKFPLIGIDWLGAVLWSMLCLQIIYLFNYGEFYDWWNSKVIRILSVTIIITFIVTIWRMNYIRHPYIEPAAWKYKNFIPLLLLVTLVEGILGCEYVLEEIFYDEVMQYPSFITRILNLWSIIGILIGCLFALLWMKVLKFSYLKLISLALFTLLLYFIVFYFNITNQLNIELLYLPLVLRGFSYAVMSIVFMVSLEELMTFQHFFQGLSIFNFLHMVVGSVMGCAIYSFGFRYFMADNVSRFGSYYDALIIRNNDMSGLIQKFMGNMEVISIRQLYGWAIYVVLVLLLLILTYDMPYARSTLKRIPNWQRIGKKMRDKLKQSINYHDED